MQGIYAPILIPDDVRKHGHFLRATTIEDVREQVAYIATSWRNLGTIFAIVWKGSELGQYQDVEEVTSPKRLRELVDSIPISGLHQLYWVAFENLDKIYR